VSDRLVRTGQFARRRPDGGLERLGSRERRVREDASRLEPDEIVATVVQHPHVRSAFVMAGTHGPVAYLVPAGEPVDTLAVEEFLRQFLPDRLLPRHYLWLDALPLAEGGKVDRAMLRALDPCAAAPATTRAPATPAAARLAAEVAALLRRPAVDANEDLFLAGGHSMLAAQLVVRMGQLFGVEPPIAAVFANPTVAGLARVMEGLAAPTTAHPAG
jgi:hypothetical protein